MDPYKLFKLSKSFTLQDLRTSYKRLAINAHPDKPTGSEYLFKYITACYKLMLKEYEKGKSDRQHFDLKASSRQYQESVPAAPQTETTTKFNRDKFNKLFETYKLKTVNDDGYGHWMESSKASRDDIGVKKIDFNNFHDVFERQPAPKTKSVTRYTEPSALESNRLGFSELGLSKLNDFGENVSSKSLNFCDYKRAHSTSRLVDPNVIVRESYNSIKDLEAERSSVQYVMSDKDRRRYEKMRHMEEVMQKQRQETLLKHDKLIEKQHKILSKLSLK